MKYLSVVACLILSLHSGAQKVEILRTSDLDPHKNNNIGSMDMLDPSAVDSGPVKYMATLRMSTITLSYGQFIRCPIGDKQTIEVSKRDNTVIVHRRLEGGVYQRFEGGGVYLGVGGCCDVVPVFETATIRDFPRGFAQLLLHTVLSREVKPAL